MEVKQCHKCGAALNDQNIKKCEHCNKEIKVHVLKKTLDYCIDLGIIEMECVHVCSSCLGNKIKYCSEECCENK